jgi:hypothetical protein
LHPTAQQGHTEGEVEAEAEEEEEGKGKEEGEEEEEGRKKEADGTNTPSEARRMCLGCLCTCLNIPGKRRLSAKEDVRTNTSTCIAASVGPVLRSGSAVLLIHTRTIALVLPAYPRITTGTIPSR